MKEPSLSEAARAKLRDALERVLASLTPDERRVLETRFGIGRETQFSLADVEREFAVTRERIRQIEARARRQLGDDPPDGAA